MKAILIDPTSGVRSVTVIDLKEGLQAIYDVLGCGNIEAPIIYPNDDAMYVDGEIWFTFSEKFDPEDEIKMGGFMFPGWSYPIFGKALIVGTDDEGDSADCRSEPADFWGIQWKNYDEMMNWGGRMGLVNV